MLRYVKEIRFLIEEEKEIEREIEMLKRELHENHVKLTFGEKDEDKEHSNEGVLWITDQNEIANKLLQKGEAVLFYLKEDTQPLTGITYCIEGFEEADYAYFDQIYCRMKNLPWYVAETERLLIREICLKDVKRLYELYEPAEITEYMENLFEKYEDEYEYTQKYIQNIYGFYGYGMWVIEEKESGRVIGRVGLEYKEEEPGLELGFMLGVEYQRKGYAYEACKAVLQYGTEILGVDEFCAYTQKGNKKSCELLKKLGFIQEKMQINGQNMLHIKKS